MKKPYIIKTLNELIERTKRIIYQGNESHKSVLNDIFLLIRGTLDEANASAWEKRINEIQWSLNGYTPNTPKSYLLNAWSSGRDELLETLVSIKKEIETSDENRKIMSGNEKTDKNSVIENIKDDDISDTIIFLSHSSSDKLYGNALRELIIGLGVKNEQLIYTSHPLHGIPLDANIYDYLHKNFGEKIFIIFLLSDTYLDSPACLCEMGAAWVTQSDYTNIYVPSFNFKNEKYIKCPIDKDKMGAILNGDDICKSKMIELKNKILLMFGLVVDEKNTTYLLDNFVKEIYGDNQ